MEKTLLTLLYIGYVFWIGLRGVQPPRGDLRVEVLDVGQGDSILVTTPDNRRILIDGGDNYESDYFLDRAAPLYCDLEMVILTHPHADHLRGLERIARRCDVGTIVFDDINYDSGLFDSWKALVGEMPDARVLAVDAGDEIEVSGVKFLVLAPETVEKKNYENINNSSIVLLLDYFDFEALLTGDAEKEVLSVVRPEEFGRYIQGGLDLFKFPHHGSKTGLDEKLMKVLAPTLTVISVGENDFGHPSSEVTDYLENSGSRMLRTDTDGTVMVLYNRYNNKKL